MYTADEIREMREKECFPIINRGELWYNFYVYVDPVRSTELRDWYLAWLNAPETRIIPTKPSWIE